jgi:hypothetical protein
MMSGILMEKRVGAILFLGTSFCFAQKTVSFPLRKSKTPGSSFVWDEGKRHLAPGSDDSGSISELVGYSSGWFFGHFDASLRTAPVSVAFLRALFFLRNIRRW